MYKIAHVLDTLLELLYELFQMLNVCSCPNMQNGQMI